MIWGFFFFKCGVQHETLFDSGGDANDMDVGFCGIISYTWKNVLKTSMTRKRVCLDMLVLLTLCPSWQEDPKSTILMADLLGLQRRMFSGFRSQWMIDSSGVAKNNNAVNKKILCLITCFLHCLHDKHFFELCYVLAQAKTICSFQCNILWFNLGIKSGWMCRLKFQWTHVLSRMAALHVWCMLHCPSTPAGLVLWRGAQCSSAEQLELQDLKRSSNN